MDDLNQQPHEDAITRPGPDDMSTKPFARLLDQDHKLVTFIAFVAELARRADTVRTVAAEALLEGAEESKREDYQETLEMPDLEQKRFRKYRRLLLEIMASRCVENYLSYVSEVLAEIFEEYPEALRSSEKVTTEFILQYNDHAELVQAIAERKVERLAYQSILDVDKYMSDRLGVPLFSESAQRDKLKLANATRNLIVHRRGIVSEKFFNDVSSQLGEPGEALNLSSDFVFDIAEEVVTCAYDFDRRAADKFGLSCHLLGKSMTDDDP